MFPSLPSFQSLGAVNPSLSTLAARLGSGSQWPRIVGCASPALRWPRGLGGGAGPRGRCRAPSVVSPSPAARRGGRRGRRSAPLREREGAARRRRLRWRRPSKRGGGAGRGARGESAPAGGAGARPGASSAGSAAEPAARDMAKAGGAGERGAGRLAGGGRDPAAQVSPSPGGRRHRDPGDRAGPQGLHMGFRAPRVLPAPRVTSRDTASCSPSSRGSGLRLSHPVQQLGAVAALREARE